MNYLFKKLFSGNYIKTKDMSETKKGNSVVVENILETTIQMYDKTIEEMVKRGVPEENIKIVREAKEDTIDAYYFKNEPSAKLEHNISILIGNEINMSNVCPMMSNLFIVRINGVPTELIQTLSNDVNNREVYIRLLEVKEFCAERFFLENRKFDCIAVEYLSRSGEVVRTDKYYGVKVKQIQPDALYYENDAPLTCSINFKYKKYVPATD